MPARKVKTIPRGAPSTTDPPVLPPSWPADTWSHYLAEIVVNTSDTDGAQEGLSIADEELRTRARLSCSSSLKKMESREVKPPSPGKKVKEAENRESSDVPTNEKNDALNRHLPLWCDSAIETREAPQGGTVALGDNEGSSRVSPTKNSISCETKKNECYKQKPVIEKRSISSVSIGEMMEMLKHVIEKQNNILKAAGADVIRRRHHEEKLRCKAMIQYSSQVATCHPSANTAVVEVAPCTSVLHVILSTSREMWKSILLDRLAKYTTVKPEAILTRTSSIFLPFYTELFDVLVEGLNSPETLSWIDSNLLGKPHIHLDPLACNGPLAGSLKKEHVPAGMTVESSTSTGLDAFGLYSVFKPPIRSLVQLDHLSPSIRTLQQYFSGLSSYPFSLRPPSSPSPTSSSKMASGIPTPVLFDGGGRGLPDKLHTLESFEEQLDSLLREGDNVEVIASILEHGVHPSLRRLFYSRALGVPLVVMEGSKRLSKKSEFSTNHFPFSGYLPSYLTFGTKRTIERIRHCQRLRSSSSSSPSPLPSSYAHERRATVLVPLAVHDVCIYVGDSEKYFVYEDDASILGTSLIIDSSSVDGKLRNCLQQLGRPYDSLGSYLVFHEPYRNGNKSEKSVSDAGRSRDTSRDAKSVAENANDDDLDHGVLPFLPGLHVESKQNKKNEVSAALNLSWKQTQSVLHAILPSGFTLLMAPICNVTGDTVEQYELVVAMMSQLWKRVVGPTPELLQCCLIFEKLTEAYALPAVTKAVRVLQHPPLLLALEWMLTGFAEVLPPSEVLIFWDLLLSYHMREMLQRSPLSCSVSNHMKIYASTPGRTPPLVAREGNDSDCKDVPQSTSSPATVPCALWLLAVMAAAIFVYRAPLVERAETREQLLQVFSSTHHLSARLLIQQLLFSG